MAVLDNIGRAVHTTLGYVIANAIADPAASGQSVSDSTELPTIDRLHTWRRNFYDIISMPLFGIPGEKPSAKAADAVKSILSFSFGIVTSTFTGI